MAGRGEIALASDLYEYSREQFNRIGSVLGMAITEYHLGEMLLMQHEPQQALTRLLESKHALEQVKARNYIPRVLAMIAEALLMVDDKEQAQASITRSLHIARELGMAVEEAVGYRILGQIAFANGNHVAADSHLKESSKRLQMMNHRDELGKVLFLQAELLIASGQQDQATRLMWEAESILKELKAKRVRR
jgi:tetratricopeptide (TPR) repeat protein